MQSHTIRRVNPNEFFTIRNLISNSYFLAKHSWTKPLSEMAYEGLMQEKWLAYACYNECEDVMSYIDYKEHKDGVIEIGICFTVEQYRGIGLAKLMLQFLFALFPNREITIGTAECNKNMISCIQHMGFQEESRVPNDRVNGDASIHYRYFPRIIKKYNIADKLILQRRMERSDYARILELWESTPEIVVREEDDSPQGIARFLTRNPNMSFILECQNKIIGTILCGHDGRRGYLHHFVVHKDFRGHGLGQGLLDSALKQLSNVGIPKAALLVFANNEKGKSFWTYHGWKQRDDLLFWDYPLNE